MRSLLQKSFISTGVVLASLALGGNAMAAGAHVGARQMAVPKASRSAADVAAVAPYPDFSAADTATSRSHPGYGIAARTPYPLGFAPSGAGAGLRVNVGQLIGLLMGGSWSVHYGGKISGSASGTYDPSWDSPSASTPIDNGAEDAANAAAAAAAQQDAADAAALDASIAAAEEQNDEANAATQQTLINNGM